MSRIYYGEDFNIQYPNRMAYAGMPALVEVLAYSTTSKNFVGAGLTVKVGDTYYTEVRTIHNRKAIFDISRYMLLAFEDKELDYLFDPDIQVTKNELAQDVSVVVQLTEADGASITALSFDVKALYGYIAYGQANGGVRYRKLFANYPQAFDFYMTPNTNLTLSVNGGEDSIIEWSNDIDEVEQLSIQLSRLWSVPENARTAILSATDSIFLNGDRLNSQETSEYRFTIDRSKSGVFLRWLDHFGQWCYYLFARTGNNYTTKEERTWQSGELRDSVKPYYDVVQSDSHLQQQLSQQQTISLGAKLVDADIFDFLLSLTNSTRVEVLLNAEEYQEDAYTTPIWERVNIVAGSYARTNAPLQDFVVSIARTATKTPML